MHSQNKSLKFYLIFPPLLQKKKQCEGYSESVVIA